MRIPAAVRPFRKRLATVRTWPVRSWVVVATVVAVVVAAAVVGDVVVAASARNAALLSGTERVARGTWVRSCRPLAGRKDPADVSRNRYAQCLEFFRIFQDFLDSEMRNFRIF